MHVKFLPSLFVFLVFGQFAEAKVSQSTSYNYFKVQGQTSREIFNSLLKHAKGPSGHDAYATTITRISQKTDFTVGKNCGLKNYRISASFKITLPKLAGAGSASAATKQNWNGFAGKLKRHEEHHRDLWVACVRSFESKVRNLQAQSCGVLGSQYKKLWMAMEKSCTAQNDAFDRQEQLNFMSQPFIQTALRGK